MSYADVEAEFGIPINTQKDWRAKSKGPRSGVIAGHVKYRRSDVLEWLDGELSRTAKGGIAKPVVDFSPLGNRSLAKV
ncbi:hypothetical protein MycrhDRAFT_1407 [Mycolicibacterium rhodesiae JS60]|nr:hypothetical protein MycrhDRAFT_1407 [Mycolicibacterium rhodesiae JS60]